MTIRFDGWRGTEDGRPVFWIKKLVKAFGCSIQLHKFVGADDPGCFHSHPAFAVRIVLRGGYVEETKAGELITRRPLYIGVIRPEFEHRIDRLLNGRESWSLWLRGPRIAKINYGCDEPDTSGRTALKEAAEEEGRG